MQRIDADSGAAIDEMFGDRAIACPCCGGTLTPTMVAAIVDASVRIEDDRAQFRRLPAGGNGPIDRKSVV